MIFSNYIKLRLPHIYQHCQTIQGSVMRICVHIHIQCVDMEDCPVKHRTNFA